MFISKSVKKRELATVCRMAFEMTGILIAILLQGIIIGNKSDGCLSLSSISNITLDLTETNAGANINNFSTIYGQNINVSNTKNWLQEFYYSQKYFSSAVVFVLIYVVCMTFFFSGSKENLGMFLMINLF